MSAPLAPLADMARHQARERPDAAACLFQGRELSFGTLDERASRIANGLLAAGCRPGARVALLSKNSDTCMEVLVGTLKANAVLLPLNWRLAVPEILFILAHSHAEVLIAEREFLPVATQARDALTGSKTLLVIDGDGADAYAAWRDAQKSADPGLAHGLDDVALQLYTSGTTGLPKGVQLTHRNYLHSMELLLQLDWQRVPAGQTMFAPAPFFHLNGISPNLRSIHAGARLLTIDQFRPPEIVEMFVRHKVNRATLAPAMIQMCLDVPGIAAMKFPDLDVITYGGSPISRRVLEQAASVFGCRFAQGYGMTETAGPLTFLTPDDHAEGKDKLLSCGKPIPRAEVRVVDPEGRDCAPRAVGEVIVRGPMVTKGYWNDEKATQATIVDGWLHTGDAAYRDEEGYIYIFDRVKEMIVSGGENIYPAEVENALFNHPDVADVAVIGVPDEKWGEAVKALVIAKPGTDPAPRAIIEHARKFIAGYKLPKSVDFVVSIPRNAAGKILRRELRKPYWEDRARNVN